MEIRVQFMFNKKEQVCIDRWGGREGEGGGVGWRAKYMIYCSRFFPPVQRHDVIFNFLLR